MKKRTIRTLSTLLAVLVLVTIGADVWNRWYNTPLKTYSHTTLAYYAAHGIAPEDYGGLSGDRRLYVTKNSLHTREYWDALIEHQMVGEEPFFRGMVRVEYSFNEIRRTYLEIVPLLEEEWSHDYAYKAHMAFAQDVESIPISEEVVRPADAYPPSVEDINKPGYYVHIRLWGEDAETIWEMLKDEFGEKVQPWNSPAQWALATQCPLPDQPALPMGFADEFEPLLARRIVSDLYAE